MSDRFYPAAYTKTIPQGEVCWQAPSNIALIKYWGKKEIQIPRNPSLSLSLIHISEPTRLQ